VLLRKVLHQAKENTTTVIIAGDFNESYEDERHNYIGDARQPTRRRIEEVLRRHGDKQPTWRKHGWEHKNEPFQQARLDDIYFNDNVQRSQLAFSIHRKQITKSDHRPVAVDLYLDDKTLAAMPRQAAVEQARRNAWNQADEPRLLEVMHQVDIKMRVIAVHECALTEIATIERVILNECKPIMQVQRKRRTQLQFKRRQHQRICKRLKQAPGAARRAELEARRLQLQTEIQAIRRRLNERLQSRTAQIAHVKRRCGMTSSKGPADLTATPLSIEAKEFDTKEEYAEAATVLFAKPCGIPVQRDPPIAQPANGTVSIKQATTYEEIAALWYQVRNAATPTGTTEAMMNRVLFTHGKESDTATRYVAAVNKLLTCEDDELDQQALTKFLSSAVSPIPKPNGTLRGIGLQLSTRKLISRVWKSRIETLVADDHQFAFLRGKDMQLNIRWLQAQIQLGNSVSQNDVKSAYTSVQPRVLYAVLRRKLDEPSARKMTNWMLVKGFRIRVRQTNGKLWYAPLHELAEPQGLVQGDILSGTLWAWVLYWVLHHPDAPTNANAFADDLASAHSGKDLDERIRNMEQEAARFKRILADFGLDTAAKKQSWIARLAATTTMANLPNPLPASSTIKHLGITMDRKGKPQVDDIVKSSIRHTQRCAATLPVPTWAAYHRQEVLSRVQHLLPYTTDKAMRINERVVRKSLSNAVRRQVKVRNHLPRKMVALVVGSMRTWKESVRIGAEWKMIAAAARIQRSGTRHEKRMVSSMQGRTVNRGGNAAMAPYQIETPTRSRRQSKDQAPDQHCEWVNVNASRPFQSHRGEANQRTIVEHIVAFTDGSVDNEPRRKHAGWGVAFKYQEHMRSSNGGEWTTVERAVNAQGQCTHMEPMYSTVAELAAIAAALVMCDCSIPVHIITDSRAALDMIASFQRVMYGAWAEKMRKQEPDQDESSAPAAAHIAQDSNKLALTPQQRINEPCWPLIEWIDFLKQYRARNGGTVTFEWVKAHNNNEGNDEADQLAKTAQPSVQERRFDNLDMPYVYMMKQDSITAELHKKLVVHPIPKHYRDQKSAEVIATIAHDFGVATADIRALRTMALTTRSSRLSAFIVAWLGRVLTDGDAEVNELTGAARLQKLWSNHFDPDVSGHYNGWMRRAGVTSAHYQMRAVHVMQQLGCLR
jgi:ribonuclease HI